MSPTRANWLTRRTGNPPPGAANTLCREKSTDGEAMTEGGQNLDFASLGTSGSTSRWEEEVEGGCVDLMDVWGGGRARPRFCWPSEIERFMLEVVGVVGKHVFAVAMADDLRRWKL